MHSVLKVADFIGDVVSPTESQAALHLVLARDKCHKNGLKTSGDIWKSIDFQYKLQKSQLQKFCS